MAVLDKDGEMAPNNCSGQIIINGAQIRLKGVQGSLVKPDFGVGMIIMVDNYCLDRNAEIHRY